MISITDTFSHVADQLRLWGETQTPTEILPFGGSAMLWPAFLHSSNADADADADDIFQQLHDDISWEQHHITLFGKTVEEPRLSAWFHVDGAPYVYSRSIREAQPFSPLLASIMKKCEQVSGSTFNCALANLYRDGTDAMGWHADDEPELGREPVIASISLGAPRRFDLRHRATGHTERIVLPNGSLLVMSGQSQHQWVHQIARTTKVTTPRINLTFRFLYP